MSAITNKGRELGRKLHNVSLDAYNMGLLADRYNPDDCARCSLIARHAVTLHRLYEDECNGHPSMGDPHCPIERAQKLQAKWEARTERETARLEKRIKELANGLPNIAGVEFNGDPRGAPVRLITQDGSGDSWADPRGWCV